MRKRQHLPHAIELIRDLLLHVRMKRERVSVAEGFEANAEELHLRMLGVGVAIPIQHRRVETEIFAPDRKLYACREQQRLALLEV